METQKRYSPDITDKKLKRRIHDTLRYTIVIETKNYTQVVYSVLRQLSDIGYIEEHLSNFWDNNEYKGVNTVIRLDQRTFRFELQFHTPDSWWAKEANHHLYRESRENDTTPQRRSELKREMSKRFDNIQTPSEVDTLRSPMQEGN